MATGELSVRWLAVGFGEKGSLIEWEKVGTMAVPCPGHFGSKWVWGLMAPIANWGRVLPAVCTGVGWFLRIL